LPTIQNLELGKGNPTLELLEKIGGTLNTSFQYVSQEPNWALLEQCGLPIYPEQEKWAKTKVIPLELAFQLRLAIHFCEKKKTEERLKEALASLIWAIQHHYPTYYSYCLESAETKIFLMKYPLKGRILKLMKMASSGLSRIL
ncbi:MAG: hypothetical protein HYY61_02895, partial [Deltaproteobacteria bacterium]|nr:hypothetical protein [Deltaproteobacteria bacterium]